MNALVGQERHPELDWDAFAPRDADNRFRLYALGGAELTLLPTTPTHEGIGVAIATLADDLREAGLDPEPISVLDGLERHWLASLWRPKL